jgi:hypothetical protein
VATLTTRASASEDDVQTALAVVAARSGPACEHSVEELTALAELLGARRFPGTGHEFGSEQDRVAARRGLLARRVLHIEEATRLRIAEADARIVATVLRASVVVSVEHRRPGGLERRLLHLSDGETILQEAAGGGLQRLTPLPEPVGAAVQRLTRLVEREPAGEPIRISRSTFEQVRDSRVAASGEEGEARLRELLANLVSSSAVSVSERGAMRGIPSLVWYDAGDGGLWLLQARDKNVTLRPAARAEIVSRLNALLSSRLGIGAR